MPQVSLCKQQNNIKVIFGTNDIEVTMMPTYYIYIYQGEKKMQSIMNIDEVKTK